MHIVQRMIRLMLLASLVIAVVGCAGSQGRTSAPTVGEPAPPLSLPTLDGAPIRLADMADRVVLVNFWASWCPPCAQETPRLVQWSQQYAKDGLVVLGVNTLFQDSQADVETFVRQYAVPYPVLLDETGDVTQQWRVQQLPRSYVIDGQGVVRFVKVGELTEHDFETQVTPLLR